MNLTGTKDLVLLHYWSFNSFLGWGLEWISEEKCFFGSFMFGQEKWQIPGMPGCRLLCLEEMLFSWWLIPGTHSDLLTWSNINQGFTLGHLTPNSSNHRCSFTASFLHFSQLCHHLDLECRWAEDMSKRVSPGTTRATLTCWVTPREEIWAFLYPSIGHMVRGQAPAQKSKNQVDFIKKQRFSDLC